jgi:hypothetical protein
MEIKRSGMKLKSYTKFPEFNPKYKAHRLKAQIQELEDELRKHQNKCKHVNKKKIPGDDYYWHDYFCPVCLKRWAND